MSEEEALLLKEEIEIIRKSRDLMKKERNEIILEFDGFWSAMRDYFPECESYSDICKRIEALQFNANQNAGGNK